MPEKRQAAVWGHGGGAGDTAAGIAYPRAQDTPAVAARQGRGPAHGVVHGDTWAKTVQSSKHQLRSPRAWALDTGDLAAAEAMGVRYVVLHDLETQRDYWASVEAIRAKGWPLARGFGAQIALAAEHWAAERPAEAKTRQLGLFEAVRR